MGESARDGAVKGVVVADDHALVRSATIALLQQIHGVAILGEAENGLEAIAMVRKLQPDMLVLDAAMPLARGIEVFAEARRWSPKTRIAVLTGFTSTGLLSEWIDAGTDGLFLKSCDPDEIARGLTAVLAGHKYIAIAVQDLLKDSLGHVSLTARERETLSLIGTGHSNAAIAERLSISIKTVEKHRSSLMAKLGVNTVAGLLACALREGLLDTQRQL